MIVTHTQNADGERRIYLGGKSSIECWIEPDDDGRSWTFHMDDAVTGNSMDTEAKHQTAIHVLTSLATALDVPPRELADVAFNTIAKLHSADPYACRRMPQGRRHQPEQGYQSTAPGTKHRRNEFYAGDYRHARRSR